MTRSRDVTTPTSGGGWKAAFTATAVYVVFRLLKMTWRMEEGPLPEEVEERIRMGTPVVYGHLHEDEWAVLGFYSKRKLGVLVSLSQDGTAMTRFLDKLGFRVIRGSSSKGAVSGFLGLLRVAERLECPNISLAVDGPRGPRRRVKKGIFKLAQELRAPIVYGVAYADRAWVFKKSWARTFIPKPFARVCLTYGPAMDITTVEQGVARDDFASLSWTLEEGFKTAKKLAEESLRTETPTP